LFVSLAMGQATAPASQSIPVEQENARKARHVLDQAIQALGGQAYLSIQDTSQEGRTYSFFHGQPNSVGLVFWRFYKFPDKDRNVEEEIYDGYRLVQGVMTPFSITRSYNGEMSNQRFLNSVTYNKGLEDSLFNVTSTYNPHQPAPKK